LIKTGAASDPQWVRFENTVHRRSAECAEEAQRLT
jgi:hypothetical protein